MPSSPDVNVLLSPSQRPRMRSLDGSATLTATILSVYDLPFREPPLQVRLTVGTQTVATGPPTQRHRDRNSFQFGTTTTNNSNHENSRRRLVIQESSLPEIYHATALLQVVYAADGNNGNSTNRTLSASYPLHQLRINETSWLILQLAPEGAIEIAKADHENDDMEEQPTLRLQLTLSGPYRREVRAMLHAGTVWLSWIDSIERSLPKLPNIDGRWIWIPLAPVAAVLVVVSPIVAGASLVTLPFFWPILLLVGGVVAFGISLFCLLYASSSRGRAACAAVLQPIAQTMLAAPLGQALAYDVGITPVTLVRPYLPLHDVASKLLLSLLIDALGSASYLVPGAGEVTDVAWAPLQTTLLMALYPEADLLPYVSFWEEFLPFTDIVPSATLGWFQEYGLPFVRSKLGA